MYSSEDLERFYFQYQTEGLPHGESIQSFCVKNKVPYNIFSEWYKDTDYQICMSHAMAKFAKAANPGGDQGALVFHDDLSLFYKLEHEYDEEGIDAEERRKRWQSLETKKIMIRLRSNRI